MKSLPLILPIILTLAACGGSSSGGNTIIDTDGVDVPVLPPVDTDAFTTVGGALAELEFFVEKSENLILTPIADIPTSGSATYDGVFSLGRIEERFPGDPDPDLVDPLIGEVELDVDFQRNTLSGNADNFFDDTRSVSGSLTISDGEIERSVDGVLFVADVVGELPINGAQRDVEGALIGGFGGNDAETIVSLFVGDADGEFPLIGTAFADN